MTCATRGVLYGRTPAFTTAAVLILAAGIGATTALFSMLDQVVIRPLHYPDPERLVVVHEILPASATPRSPVNAAHFEEWRAATRSFDEMALLLPVSFTLTGASDAEQIGGARVSGLFFTMLGASILHGRAFSSMVLVQALAPVVTGMSAGLVVALGIAPLLRGHVFGISPSDPRVFAFAALALGTVSAVVGYLPGLRASRVNPIVAMRSE